MRQFLMFSRSKINAAFRFAWLILVFCVYPPARAASGGVVHQTPPYIAIQHLES